MTKFYEYFKENMDGLGLPAPNSLFGTVQAAVANVTIMLGHIDKFGRAVTLRELAGAGTRLECLSVIAACSAAFYVGAVVGSIAIATGRTLAGGTSIADVIFMARQNGLDREWLLRSLYQWPAIYDSHIKHRKTYHTRALPL